MSFLRLAVALVFLLTAASANAMSIFVLTEDHCTGGCGAAPYGDVTLVQNGADVDITVSLNAPNAYVKTGAVDFQAFKFNGLDIVLGDITVDQTVPGQTLAPMTGALNGDGTGMFSFGIECTTCGNGASDPFTNDIVFHVANATIADLTGTNNLGNIFVADIIGSTGNTGPVAAIVPEPASFAMVALGLAGLAIRRRRP